MGAPGMTSPIRTETFKKLQLNAGILLEDFDHSSITDAATLKAAIVSAVTAGTKILGCTRGGGSFTATRELRTPDVDGARYPFKGQDFVDSVDANIATTLIELTPKNLERVCATLSKVTDGAKTSYSFRTAVDPDTDYLPNLVWVGDIADGGYVMIELFNAFNTADISIKWTDKGEAEVPVEFHARQDDVLAYDTAPFKIHFLEADGTLAALTVASAAGTNVGGTAITVSPAKASGEKYVYKIGTTTSAPSIVYGEEADYTWTEWDGSSDIAVGAANNGKKITIAILNSNGRAIKSGNATLVVKTA